MEFACSPGAGGFPPGAAFSSKVNSPISDCDQGTAKELKLVPGWPPLLLD